MSDAATAWDEDMVITVESASLWLARPRRVRACGSVVAAWMLQRPSSSSS